MLKAAWEEVSPRTIKNCFAKAGFFCDLEPEIELIEPPLDWTTISNGLLYEDFLRVDENVSTLGQLTTEEIVAQIQNKKACEAESSEEEFEEAGVEEKLPTNTEAYDFLQKTMMFVEAQENVPDNIFAAAHSLDTFLLNCQVHKKQKKITDFFQKSNA